MVENYNESYPENFSNPKDFLPAPETLNIVFQVIGPWRHSGNFSVGEARLKIVSNIRFRKMSGFHIFCKIYLMKHIKDVVIYETNKHLKSPVVLGKYF